MRGLGTIINALAIVIGGVLGILFKRFLKERYQDTIIKATGFSVVFLFFRDRPITNKRATAIRTFHHGEMIYNTTNNSHCTD